MRILQLPAWPPPQGYANGILAHGKLIFVAGQVGWNSAQQFESDDLVAQIRQALQNIVAVLEVAGAQPQHLVRLTWYVTDKGEYQRRRREVGQVYREVIGKHFPAMTLVEVSGLLEEQAKVEIEATAVLPAEV